MRLSSEKNYADVMRLIGGVTNINRLYELLLPYVVAEHYSPSTQESFIELVCTDPEDLLAWTLNHRDAIMVEYDWKKMLRNWATKMESSSSLS